MPDVSLHPGVTGPLALRRPARVARLLPANIDTPPSARPPSGAVAGGSAADLRPGEPRRAYRRFGKRCLDIVLVLMLCPIYLPLIGVAALLLFVEGGNPLYRQDRLGRGGARFSMLKMRTMFPDADARLTAILESDPEMKREWEVSQKLRHDPRITPVGDILRRTSMDELPQLWNVLTGEMSLVGPRPMRPGQLPLYGDPAHYFAVRPGITGDWQVGRRNESSFADRARYDAAYDAALSLGHDLRVLWKTIGVVVKCTGW